MNAHVRTLLILLILIPLLSGCGGVALSGGAAAGGFVVAMLSGVLFISVRKCGWKGMKDLNLFCSWIGWYMLFLQMIIILFFVI